MDPDKLITGVAGALVLLPSAVNAAVPEAAGDARIQVVLLILAAIGAAILKQSEPAGKKGRAKAESPPPLSDAELRRIAREVVRVQRNIERVEREREAAVRG